MINVCFVNERNKIYVLDKPHFSEFCLSCVFGSRSICSDVRTLNPYRRSGGDRNRPKALMRDRF